jgi:hypothetical protein
VPDVLIIGDTSRVLESSRGSARRVRPLVSIERAGARHVFVHSTEGQRITELDLGSEHGYGGVRLRALVPGTEDGCQVLTDFPYELEVANG